MSDTEEVVIPRATKQTPTVKKVTNPNPQVAREKMKEKRERLKKEKEDFIIEEAKKKLAIQMEKKAQEEALAKEQEALAKQQEEERRKSDPTYIMMKQMEQMMALIQKQTPEPVKPKAKPKKKVVIEEEEPEEKPKRKPRVAKEIVDKPNKSPGLPKPRKKVVYLQPERLESNSTQFVGYDIAPPAEPIQYQPSSGLLAALMSRRNMNSIYQ
jgi:hypothetical protein